MTTITQTEVSINVLYRKTGLTNYGLEASSCNAISEGRPPFSNTSLEAGALPLEDVSRMTRTENFLSLNFFIFFWKTTLLHVSCYSVHCEPKIFFRCFEVCTYPSIHNFGLEASPL